MPRSAEVRCVAAACASSRYARAWRWRNAATTASPASASRSPAYSRIVSSIRNRASPCASSRIRMRLCSASVSMPARTSMSGVPASSAPHTASAVANVPPPWNTDRRANSRRLSASSRSWLQSIAPRSVRWRSGRSRPPADSRPSRSLSRATIAAGVRIRTRAAASSMASGRPSSRRTISATAAALSAVSVNPWRTAMARSRNRRTASEPAIASRSVAAAGGTGSGGTANSCSPAIRSGARLDTIIRSFGAPRRISATTGAPATTCSKLSRTMSAVRSPKCSTTRWSGVRAGASSPTAVAIEDAIRSGSVTAARGTNHTPPGLAAITSLATARDRRVLPVPPGPVSVSSRVRDRRATAADTSSRPTNDVSCWGRLLGVASSDRSGGKSRSSPGASTWYTRSGRGRSLSRWSPRSRNVKASVASPARTRVGSETTTWPPCAVDAIRAARWISMPT